MLGMCLALKLTTGIIPVAVTAAVIQTESAGNHLAVSSKGAKGLMQLTPIALQDIKQNNKKLPKVCERITPNSNMFDKKTNVIAGECYLKLMKLRFPTDLVKVIAAYNAGPTRVSKPDRLPLETRKYIQKVLIFIRAKHTCREVKK